MKSELNIVEQVDLLKKKVLLSHPDFKHTYGMIVSIRVSSNYYWILLDNLYTNRRGKRTRLRMFNEKYLKVIEE